MLGWVRQNGGELWVGWVWCGLVGLGLNRDGWRVVDGWVGSLLGVVLGGQYKICKYRKYEYQARIRNSNPDTRIFFPPLLPSSPIFFVGCGHHGQAILYPVYGFQRVLLRVGRDIQHDHAAGEITPETGADPSAEASAGGEGGSAGHAGRQPN